MLCPGAPSSLKPIPCPQPAALYAHLLCCYSGLDGRWSAPVPHLPLSVDASVKTTSSTTWWAYLLQHRTRGAVRRICTAWLPGTKITQDMLQPKVRGPSPTRRAALRTCLGGCRTWTVSPRTLGEPLGPGWGGWPKSDHPLGPAGPGHC